MAREKSKDPMELAVDVKLKNLYSLQTMLSEIDAIKILRGELPLEVQDLEDEIEGLTTRVGKMLDQIDDLRREINDRRATIDRNYMDLDRYRDQLNNVRNNREFDALTKEIEYIELDNQLHDKKIREAQDNIERLQDNVRRCNGDLSERRADLDLKKSELDEIISDTRSEEEKLRERSKAIELTIDSRLLSAFKRIRKNARNGLGIVYVHRDACGGCFNKIPPQRQLDVRMHKKIIVCEYCGRILIDPELAGVELNKPAVEEKPKRRGARRRKDAE
ncbi:MAG: C4-type zinc ribbon domain-containing protein [Bacteroidaceae bacterium]|nr:C4-type zinc ribbon domain-containing protein [Bacteroidaceae bacterium]